VGALSRYGGSRSPLPDVDPSRCHFMKVGAATEWYDTSETAVRGNEAPRVRAEPCGGRRGLLPFHLRPIACCSDIQCPRFVQTYLCVFRCCVKDVRVVITLSSLHS